MRVLGCDTGPLHTGVVVVDFRDSLPVSRVQFSRPAVPNELVEKWCAASHLDVGAPAYRYCFEHVAVEVLTSYGRKRPGRVVFESTKWAGRLMGAAFDRGGLTRSEHSRVAVKDHILGTAAGADSDIRDELIERFGGVPRAVGGVRCHVCKGKGYRGRARKLLPILEIGESRVRATPGWIRVDEGKAGPREYLACEQCHGSKWTCKPGPLYSISSHCWSALAVAVTAWAQVR